MVYFLVDVCSDPTMKNVMAVVKLLMNIICIIVPIVLIILGSIDLFKHVGILLTET